MEQSHFPLLILVVRTNEKKVVHKPEDLPQGEDFKVLKTVNDFASKAEIRRLVNQLNVLKEAK